MKLFLAFVIFIGGSSAFAAPTQPSVQSLMNHEEYLRVLKDREVFTSAHVQSEGVGDYEVQSAVLIRSSLDETRRLLIDDPGVYAKLVRYITISRRDPKTGLLEVEGRIFNYRMHSWIRMTKISDGWTTFEIVNGNFTGMTGEILLEPKDQGTLVYMHAQERGPAPAPRFILETGAQIVFGFTARRMRSYVESKKIESFGPFPETDGDKKNDPGIPQPRSHL